MKKTSTRPVVWDTLDFPQELKPKEFETWARLAAANGATHVIVSRLPFSWWQLDDPRDAHPEWSSWPVWSIANAAIFKVVVPEELAAWLPCDEARANLELLKKRCRILRRLGLKGVFAGNDPMWLPEGVYEAHPEWRGAQGELSRIAHLPYFSPCIDHPEVLAMYRRAMAELCRALPEIDMFDFFTNDSCGGVCWATPYPGNNGPEPCRNRPIADRIGGFLDALQQGARDAGVDIRVHLDNLRYVDRTVHDCLKPGQAVNGRDHEGKPWWSLVNYGRFIFDQTFPVVGIPQPFRFLEELEAAVRGPAGQVVIGRWAHLETLQARIIAAYRASPTNGPASRMDLLRDVAAGLAGEEHAESLLTVWQHIERATAHASHVHLKGVYGMSLCGPAMMRWLLMPLVPDITRVREQDKAVYRKGRVIRIPIEADSYHAILGETGIVGTAGVWMARHAFTMAMAEVDKALDVLATLPAAADSAILDTRLRAYRCVLLTMRNFIDYQHLLAAGDPCASRLVWRPELFGDNDNSQASLPLRQVARSEADNAVALARLIETAGAPVLSMAPTPDKETPFHFHPDLAAQLRRKSAIIFERWVDYLELYPPVPVTCDIPPGWIDAMPEFDSDISGGNAAGALV